jgi:hypothetical protein
VEDLEKQLEFNAGGASSVEEVRAILATVQMNRELERLDHLKTLVDLRERHESIERELAQSRVIDAHQVCCLC